MITIIKGNDHLHNERGGKSLRRLASVVQKMVNIANDDDDGFGYDDNCNDYNYHYVKFLLSKSR